MSRGATLVQANLSTQLPHRPTNKKTPLPDRGEMSRGTTLFRKPSFLLFGYGNQSDILVT